MRWLNYITTGLSLLMATGALFFLPVPASWIVAAIFAAIAAFAITTKGKTEKNETHEQSALRDVMEET